MKKYKDYTPEEKAEYKRKRDEYWKKRDDSKSASFNLLESELRKLNVPANVLQLLEKCRDSKSDVSTRKTYLEQIFGSNEPAIGTKVRFRQTQYFGINGERMGYDESLKDFIVRVGDIKESKLKVTEMIWYCDKNGNNLEVDKINATITYKGKKAV
jgi:hypothetical protein